MRKTNEQPLADVINELIDAYKLRDRLNEVRLSHAWESLMGEAVARRTVRIGLRHKELSIEVTSAPLKQELFSSRDKLRTLLNEALGGAYIENVVIR